MNTENFINSLRHRLDEAAKNAKKYHMDPARQAGLFVEYRVRQDLLDRFCGTGWSLRMNIRVPDPIMKRRREIDFVITSPNEVIAIELKNWSGSLHIGNGGSIIQHPRGLPRVIPHRHRNPINHGDIFRDLKDKIDFLRLYHHCLRETTVFIRGFVVFFNNRLLLPKSIADRSDVLTYSKLLNFMPTKREESSVVNRILIAIFRFLGYKPTDGLNAFVSISPSMQTFHDTLAELGSWDVVELFGGRIIVGDFLDLPTVSRTDENMFFLNRRIMKRIDISMERSMVKSLFYMPPQKARIQVVTRSGNTITSTLPVNLELLIHGAGQVKPDIFLARNIVSIDFGYISKPTFARYCRDLQKGTRYIGVVNDVNECGVYIDIGLCGQNGKSCYALAPANMFKQPYDINAIRNKFPLQSRVIINIDEVVVDKDRIRASIIGQ